MSKKAKWYKACLNVKKEGDYQYGEANIRLANALHTFGWLTGRKTQHENKKGEKVYTIRRDLQIGTDPIVKKAESQWKGLIRYYDKAKSKKGQKRMTRKHGWGQFFAILCMIVFGLVGATFMFAEQIDGLIGGEEGLIVPIVDEVKGMIADNVSFIADYVEFLPYVFFVIAGISLISIFINNGRYKKRSNAAINVDNAIKDASERICELKANNRYLMTSSDKKIADIGRTFQRVMDRNVDEYE